MRLTAKSISEVNVGRHHVARDQLDRTNDRGFATPSYSSVDLASEKSKRLAWTFSKQPLLERARGLAGVLQPSRGAFVVLACVATGG